MPTIKDIAKAAGVSHGTVSNVLNKTGKVSAHKIRLVEEAVKQLGYVPNAQAQLLRQGAANHIAVILPNINDARYLSLFLALQTCLQKHDFEVSAHATDDIASNEEMLLRRLLLSNLAGIVTVSGLQGAAVRAYDSLPCPVVAVNRRLNLERPLLTEIGFDHYLAGHDIGRYILRRQWKRAAFFCASWNQSDDSAVLAGMTDVLESAAVSVKKFSSDTALVMNKAFDIMREPQPFDVIVTVNGMRAETIATVAKALYVRQHPALVSIDTSQIFPNPFYRAYEMDYGEMGARISDILLAHLRGKRPLPKEVPLISKGFSFAFPHVKKGISQSLSMLALESPAMSALGNLLPMLEALTGITLKITSMPYGDLSAHLELINDRFHYDLIRMDIAWMSSMGRRVYLPLQEAGIAKDMLSRNLIRPMHSNYYLADGILCGLPFDPSVQIFLYRTDLFQDATLRRLYYEKYREPLSVPETVGQYLRVAEFFTRNRNPDSPTQYGTTITSGTAITAACDFLPYYLASGGSVCDTNGKPLLNTPAMLTALREYHEMQRYVSAEENQWWRDSMRQFADGNTATVHTFSNHASYLINSKQSHVVGKTGAAVMPGGHPLLGGGVLGICRYSPNVQACGEFFNWFYTKDIASAMVRLGGTSPLADAYSNYENFSVLPWLSVEKESFSIGTRGCAMDAPGISYRDYEYALGTAVRGMLNHTLTPEEAAVFAQTIYDRKVMENHA